MTDIGELQVRDAAPLAELLPALLDSGEMPLRSSQYELGVGGAKSVVEGSVIWWPVLRKRIGGLRGEIRSGNPVRILTKGVLFG